MQHRLAHPQRPSTRSSVLIRLPLALLVVASGIFTVATISQPAFAIGTTVNLGTAASYSVLGGATVTNTGPSTLSGNVGVSPGTAITGFPPGITGGVKHAADAHALQAQVDLTTAFNAAAGQASSGGLAAGIGGQTLLPGVYTAESATLLTGTLTLDADGDPGAVFIFQIGSALTTATSSSVVLLNGAQRCNVFWQVGSSATLGTNSTFVGTIMALTSISANTGATIEGRALARNGSVTLDNNVFKDATCAGNSATTTATATATQSVTSTASSTATASNTATSTATATNTATSTATATNTATSTATATATATASNTTGFSISPTTLEFPLTAVGDTSAGIAVVVTNLAASPQTLSVAGGVPENPNFTEEQNCQGAMMEQGSSCQFTYKFAPKTAGAHSGTTNFVVNDQSSGTITLSGTATSTASASSTASSTTTATSTATATAVSTISGGENSSLDQLADTGSGVSGWIIASAIGAVLVGLGLILAGWRRRTV